MSIPTIKDAARDAGLVVAGEPLAVDLADTIKMSFDPPRDLIQDLQRNEMFWRVEQSQLPDGAGVADLENTKQLRAAIRKLFDAKVDGAPLDADALLVINKYAAAAIAQPQLSVTEQSSVARVNWISETPGDLSLAVAARSAIDVVTGPNAGRLRRCASHTCSMFFVALNAKRQWCTPDGCGNRERVARHARATVPA